MSLGGSTKPSGGLFKSSGKGVLPFDVSMAAMGDVTIAARSFWAHAKY